MSTGSSPDRRQHLRTATSGRGLVMAPGLEVACVIVDTSSGGMRLRLDRNLGLPLRFVLIDIESGTAHQAETAWRQSSEIGLKLGERTSLRGLVPSRRLAEREAWLRAGGR